MPSIRQRQQSTSLPHDELVPQVLMVPNRAAALLEGYARASYPEETGGILIGRHDGLHITVTHIVGPGPQATHKPGRFWRDGQHAKRELDRIYAKTGGETDYIGEWHSHPISGPPSTIDKATMRCISNDPAYGIATPILIIMQHEPTTKTWTPSAFACRTGRLTILSVHKGIVGVESSIPPSDVTNL